MIVCHLLNGPRRYNELRRVIPPLSAKVLTENLETMEKEGILLRDARPSRPIEVRYRLTPKGEDLALVVRAMNMWGERWLTPIQTQPSLRG